MKRIPQLIFLIFFGFRGNALEHESRIIITYPHSQGAWVQVDGKRYDGYGNSVVISNLRPGRHQIRVYGKDQRNSGIFGIFGNRDRLVYSNNLNLRPGYNLHVNIDRYGRAKVNEQPVNGRNKRDRDDRDKRDDRDWDYRGGDNRDKNDRDRDGWGFGDYNGNQVSHGEFLRMMDRLRWENREQERLNLARQYVQGRAFSTSQIRQLVQLFNYDSQKLDLAKWAYRNTIDKGNYSILLAEFRSKKSKKELEKFIRNYR